MSYLAIIMALSITFSWILYRLSTGELDRGLRRPPVVLQLQGDSGSLSYDQYRVIQLNESSEHLRANLVLFNVITLIVGGAFSYFLARRSLEPIEEAMEAQSRFTADASHELRTPLTAMQTEIEVALRNPNLDTKAAKDLLKSNLEEVAKLRMLSEGLLRLARQNGQQLELKSVPLSEAANAGVTRFERHAKAKKIIIDTAGVKDVSVVADREAVIEVIAILLDNAIKYSDNNKTVNISTRKHGHSGEIRIADEGMGIKPEDIDHIFERFYRSDTSRSKENADGYGLGLSIADKIVHLHNGTIDVKSTQGKGSVFTVKLPLASNQPENAKDKKPPKKNLPKQA